MGRWHALAVVLALAIVAGVIAISGFDNPGNEIKVGDHYHARLAVFVCGQDIGPAPAFEQRADEPERRAGVHTHGDGFVHVHPFSSDEAGENATVGRFLLSAGYELSADEMELWDGEPRARGDSCPDGRPGEVRWTVNGEEQDGDPARYRLEDGDVIVIAFVPEGDEVPTAPQAAPTQD